MKILRSLFFLFAVLLALPAFALRHSGGVAVPTSGDPTTGVLPSYNDTYTNWANAGLLPVGGIPNRTTQCGSTVAISGSDDSSNINSAITSCTAGDYVLLAAGTVSIFTGSITSTTLTTPGASGCAIGDVIGDAGGLVLLNTTITSGSSTTWTVNINHPTATGSETMWCVVPFKITQSEYIALNKSVSLRGSGSLINGGTCFSVCWPTVISMTNGAVPNWSVSNTANNVQCGTTSASASTGNCTAATGAILMSPSGNYNWGWAGCFFGVNPTTGNCGTTLTADAAQGAYSVQVTSTANFSVGMDVLIDESPQVVSTTNPIAGQAALEASPEFLNTSGAPAVMRLEGGDIPGAYSFIGSGGGSQGNQRLNEEIHKIAGIGAAQCSSISGANANTICFTDPLSLAFRQSGSHDARLYWPTVQGSTANPFLFEAGVENLTIMGTPNGAIQATFCDSCWVKNVEVGGWAFGAVNHVYTFRNQIEIGYFHNCDDCENNGSEYPIGISQAATESYVVNNIIVLGGKGMVGRAANTAVVAYNYVDDTFYMQAVTGDYWRDMAVNGSHYAGTHHFLFEGNWGDNCDSDETHGNAIYHTFFRNDCTGIRTTFVDPSIRSITVNDSTGTGIATTTAPAFVSCPASCFNSPLRAAGPMAFDYWMAFVGNVLGTSGITTTGNGYVYSSNNGQNTNKALWMSGWTGSEWSDIADPNLSTATSPNFIFRHGDYDYVTGAVNDWTTGYSHTLPNSFYLVSQPSWWPTNTSCSPYPWPWVTSTSGTVLQVNGCSNSGLPAKARWNAGTPFTQP